MDELTWDEARHRWLGHAAVEGVGRVRVAVDPGEAEPDLAVE